MTRRAARSLTGPTGSTGATVPDSRSVGFLNADFVMGFVDSHRNRRRDVVARLADSPDFVPPLPADVQRSSGDRLRGRAILPGRPRRARTLPADLDLTASSRR